ncbi:MAG: DMT family transporter [Candidatus Kapaibacterium sp.]|jgi:drug/metabolite transporter (DMT)-like permease
MTKSSRADILLLLIALIWAATFIVIKYALDDVPPFLFTGLRFLLASGVGLLLWGKYLRSLTVKDIQQGTILGIVFGIGFLLQTWGLQYTTIAKSSFITGSMVIFTPIVYYLIERRPVTLMQKIGVLVVTLGLWIFTDPNFSSVNKGDIATLICAVLWGVYITLTDVYTANREDILEHSARLTLLQFISTCIISSIAYLLYEHTSMADFQQLLHISFTAQDALIAICYTAFLGSVIATYIQTRWQRDSSPVKAALIFSLEPIIASILAYLYISEQFGWREFIGGSIVLLGVLMGEIGENVYNALKGKRK